MFERAEQWSQDLEDNYEQLDKWKRKGDYLLYSMLPKSVADQLQNGQSTMDTCKVKVENILPYPFLKQKNTVFGKINETFIFEKMIII